MNVIKRRGELSLSLSQILLYLLLCPFITCVTLSYSLEGFNSHKSVLRVYMSVINVGNYKE